MSNLQSCTVHRNRVESYGIIFYCHREIQRYNEICYIQISIVNLQRYTEIQRYTSISFAKFYTQTSSQTAATHQNHSMMILMGYDGTIMMITFSQRFQTTPPTRIGISSRSMSRCRRAAIAPSCRAVSSFFSIFSMGQVKKKSAIHGFQIVVGSCPLETSDSRTRGQVTIEDFQNCSKIGAFPDRLNLTKHILYGIAFVGVFNLFQFVSPISGPSQSQS